MRTVKRQQRRHGQPTSDFETVRTSSRCASMPESYAKSMFCAAARIDTPDGARTRGDALMRA